MAFIPGAGRLYFVSGGNYADATVLIMKKLKQNLLELALHILLPKTCLHCGQDLKFKSADHLCPKCLDNLEKILPLYCQRCGIPLSGGGAHCFRCRGSLAGKYKCDKIRSAFVFNKEIRSLIHHLKYKHKQGISVFFAVSLVEALFRYEEIQNFDLIIPVPLSAKRLRARGFNQSELIAKDLSVLTKTDSSNDLLIKFKETSPQTKLNRKERLENIKNAFMVTKPKEVAKKNILLIDDVATTGSTFEECAKALKKCRAKRVFALSVARETF
jgi:ComF family protein